MYVYPSSATATQPAKVIDKTVSPELDDLMTKYLQLAARKILEGDTSAQSINALDKMMRTQILYYQTKVRLGQRERALRIKEEEHQVKMNKAAEEKAAKEAVGRMDTSPPTQADRIAAMRREYFKEIDEESERWEMVMPTEDNWHPIQPWETERQAKVDAKRATEKVAAERFRQSGKAMAMR